MYLELPECRVHYELAGHGPMVVILHGFSLDMHHLKRPMELAFAKTAGFARLHFDLPGMGRTITHRQLTCAEEMFAIVTQVIDAVVGTQPFAVVGGSYGAYLARRLVSERSAQVTGALYIAPVIFADHSRRTLPPKVVLEEDPSLRDRLSPEDYASFIDVAVIANEQTWQMHRADIVPGLSRANSPFLDMYMKSGYAFTDEPDGGFESFDRPALILAGRQDHIVGYQDSCRLLPHYSHATFCVFDRCGHNLPIERPELFQMLTVEWLRQLA